MQISRHWRMNANRYRLVGMRYENGQVSAYTRPAPVSQLSEPSADNRDEIAETELSALATDTAA